MQTQQWTWAVLPTVTVLALLIHAISVPMPRPLGPDADPSVFSAERAAAHLDKIAAAPHPMGSAAHGDVRDYLAAQLKGLGFDTQIDDYTVRTAGIGSLTLAHVKNVSALLPGTRGGGPALMLMSHYDSVPQSFGAGDDGLGTLSILEVARAMASGPRPANDILIVMTDGEESGLWGARAFFNQDPRADNVGFVINLECRGSKGPAILFETSAPNDGLIRAIAPVLPNPMASSISQAVYQLAPNSTDFTPALRRGLQGVNFANLDGFYDYHRHTDRAEYLSHATIQHLGDQVLAITRALANEDLPLKAETNLSYHGAWGLGLVVLPGWVGWVLLLTVAGGFGLFLAVDVRKERLRLVDLARAVTLPLALLFIFLLLAFLTAGLGGGSPFTDPVGFARLAAWGDMSAIGLCLLMAGVAGFAIIQVMRGKGRALAVLWLILGGVTAMVSVLPWFVPLIVGGLAAGLSLFLMRPLPERAVDLGAFAFLLLLCGGAQSGLAQGAYLFTLPLLFALMALFASDRARPGLRAIIIYGAILVPALVLLLGFGRLLHLGLGVYFSAVLAVPVLLLVLICMPLLRATAVSFKGAGAGLAAVIGTGLLIWSLGLGDFSARHPRPVDLVYVVDADTQTASYASRDARPGRWFDSVLDQPPAPLDVAIRLFGFQQSLTGGPAPAAPDDFGAASLEIVSQLETTDGDRDLELLIRPRQPGDILIFSIDDASMISALSFTRPQSEQDLNRDRLSVLVFSAPEQGIRLHLTSRSAEPLSASLLSVAATMPDAIVTALPPLPEDHMPAGGYGRAGSFGAVWSGKVSF